MGGGSKKQTIGYKYYMGMHMVLCQGPVDAIVQLYAGEKAIPGSGAVSNTSLSINAPDLFGGDRKEGGIVGQVDVLLGGDTQGQNSYLVNQLGSSVPSFRGVVSLVLRKVYLCAMSPYPKAWWASIRRIPARSWYPAKANMSGSANPAHIIYEAATSKLYGLGYPESQMDQAAFIKAADTLYAEDFRMSLVLSGEGSVEEFIQIVLDHIDGTFYLNQRTGLFTLKLLRADYLVSSLPTYDESNVLSLGSFQRALPSETVNEVVIVYRPMGATKDSSLTFQDLASIQAQGGVISQRLNYTGLDTSGLATKVGLRELKVRSSPLASIRIEVNRKAWNLNPGDPFKFSWPAYGISQMIFRAVLINYGDLTDGKITIDAVEDVFGLPSAMYEDPPETEWIDPISDPVPVVSQRLWELPYYVLATTMSAADFQAEFTDSSVWVQSMAKAPVVSPGYSLYVRPTGGTYVDPTDHEAEWTPECTLSSPMGKSDTTLTVSYIDPSLLRIGGWALIDNEIVRIDSVDMANFHIVVGRGCMDTVPESHAGGTRIWFGDGAGGYDSTEYVAGEVLFAKLTTKTGKGVLSLSAASEVSLTTTGRAGKPYPPGRFQINGDLAYPSNISGALTVGWVERNRLTQTASLLDVLAGNVPAEPGTTHSVSFYGEQGTLLRQVTGLAAPVYSRTWDEELSDSALFVVAPPFYHDVLVPMDLSPYIQGPGRDPLVPSGSGLNGVTFDGTKALFSTGCFGIGTPLVNGARSLSFTVQLTDPSMDGNIKTVLSLVSSAYSPIISIACYGASYRVIMGGSTQAISGHTGGKEVCLLAIIESDQPSVGQTRVTLYEDNQLLGTAVFSSSIPDLSSVIWSIGGVPTSASTWSSRFTGTMRKMRLFFGQVLAPPLVWVSNRLNNSLRVDLASTRGGVVCHQGFSHSFLRRGWTYQFNDYYNG